MTLSKGWMRPYKVSGDYIPIYQLGTSLVVARVQSIVDYLNRDGYTGILSRDDHMMGRLIHHSKIGA